MKQKGLKKSLLILSLALLFLGSRYQKKLGVAADGLSLSGQVTQSGVSDKFKMLVPVYVDFGKGFVRIGVATITGNSSVDLKNVKFPTVAKRAAICALDDILALSIQNSK